MIKDGSILLLPAGKVVQKRDTDGNRFGIDCIVYAEGRVSSVIDDLIMTISIEPKSAIPVRTLWLHLQIFDSRLFAGESCPWVYFFSLNN